MDIREVGFYRPIGEQEVEVVIIKSSSLDEGIKKLVEFFKEAQKIPEVRKLMEKYGIRIERRKAGVFTIGEW